MEKKIGLLLVILCLLFCGGQGVQAAPFQNGDFSSGDFKGWSGSLTDVGYGVTIVDPDLSSYYKIVDADQKGQLSLDDTYWQNTLYQDFDLDSLLSGWTMTISFWLQWSPSSSDDDGISVTLSDPGYTDTVNLLGGVSDSDLLGGVLVSKDITTFAKNYGGKGVELAFTIWDLDWDTSDTLRIDNITFNKSPAPVPEPSILWFLGFGLVWLGVLLRKRA